MRGSDLKAKHSTDGETPLDPKRLRHNRHHMIRAHGRQRINPKHAPT
jgi:hypothetical protein